MKNYNVQVLYPWDDTWYTLEFTGPFYTKRGAVKAILKDRSEFPFLHTGKLKYRWINTKTGRTGEV